MSSELTTESADSIVATVRTALGDSTRCIVWFTADEFSVCYLRSDLTRDGAGPRKLMHFFVENERGGFETGSLYSDLSKAPEGEPEIGEYGFTIRVFDDGFVVPIITGDQGVLVTTDGIDMDSFEEAAVAVRRLLAADQSPEETPGTPA